VKILVTYRGNQGPGAGWETGAALVRALRRMGHQAHPYGTVYQTGQRIAPEAPWKPELIIFMECGDGDQQYIEFATRTCPMAMWLFDTGRDEKYQEHHRLLVDHLKPEHLFMANPDMIPSFPGSKYLPYAADETRFKPVATMGEKSGTAIIGNHFPERDEFARRVGVEVIQTETGQEYADAVAGLQVHVHHTNSGGSGLLVMRYWETLCCGTVLLCPDDAAVRRHFEPGVHLVTYPDAEVAAQLVSAMQCGNWAIADVGRAHVLAHHTYRHRAQEILDSL